MAFRSKYRFWLLCMGLFLSSVVQAQFRLPPFDVELKVSETVIPSNNNYQPAVVNTDLLETTNIYGAAHLQFGQHLAVGWLYAKSFRGQVKYSSNGFQTAPNSEMASLLMFGPDLRYTTGRAKKTRLSVSVNYTQVEFVDDKGGYRLAHKANAIGASFGLIKRLSNTIDFNIIELGVKAILGEKTFWLNTDIMLEAKTGLTFNFSKRK